MFPRMIRACVLMLVACCGHADAEPAQTEALRFQQNLLAVLECRASADTRQTVASTLRAARYGDPAGRPLHLRDWHFEQAGDADAAAVTVIELPVPLTVQGVRTQRVFAGAQGLSIAINAAARDRIVARHGLQLQSSTLREPFRVWTARPVEGNASAPSIMVSSDGDGYRLGCTAPAASTQGTLPLDRQQREDANDLAAAIECRADDAALRRVGRLLQQVMEQPQSEWPAEVHAVALGDAGGFDRSQHLVHLLGVLAHGAVAVGGLGDHTGRQRGHIRHAGGFGVGRDVQQGAFGRGGDRHARMRSAARCFRSSRSNCRRRCRSRASPPTRYWPHRPA